MREILFRAKRISNSEWVQGNLITDEQNESNVFIGYVSGTNPDETIDDVDLARVDPLTICQSTGLTDKNGQKIFENDVVKKHFYTDYDNYANSEEYIGFVKYEDCAWVIETKANNRICTIPIIEAMAYSKDIEHFEVIGNIFENPELINE